MVVRQMKMVNNDLIVVFAILEWKEGSGSGAQFFCRCIRKKRGGVTVVIGWAELVA